MMSMETDITRQIKGSITFEFYRVLGIERHRWLQRLITPLIDLPTTRFSRLLTEFDTQVNRDGLQETANKFLERFIEQKQILGQEHIPTNGPVIIASNHPGAFDGLLLVGSIPRRDLKIVVTGVTVLQALPEMNLHFIYTSEDPHQRMATFRAALRHLQGGGALLTFGTGIVDPDPAFLGTASTELVPWSDSLALLLQKCPSTRMVPAIVSEVLDRYYYDLILVRWLQDRVRRQKLAEYLMVMNILRRSNKFNFVPRLSFGNPYCLRSFHQTTTEITTDIMTLANQLLGEHMQAFY